MSTKLLEAQQLRVEVAGKAVVQQFDLVLAPGDSVVILGRNGAGKSTLLSTLAGLRKPDGGAVLLGLQFLMSTWGGHWRVLLFRGVLGFVFMLTGNLLKKPLTEFKWWKIVCAFLLTAATSAL